MRKFNYLENKRKIKLLLIIFIILFFIIIYFIYENNNKNKEIIIDNDVLLNTNDDDNNLNYKKQEEKFILVHVDGAVNNPGIIELKENSRICDAIEKAGGITEDANLKNINLAFFLEDGMKIFIPTNNKEKGEINMDENNEINNNVDENILDNLEYVTEESGGTSLEAFSNGKNNNSNNKRININTANESELSSLPGIGEATALKIINYRNENGKYNSIDDLKNVKGIGENKFENIKDFIICK